MRRCVGAAAQAGTEAGLFRGRRTGIEAEVAAARRRGRASGPAVNPGCRDGGDESPFEAAVPAGESPVAVLGVEMHDPFIQRPAAEDRTFPDIVVDIVAGEFAPALSASRAQLDAAGA